MFSRRVLLAIMLALPACNAFSLGSAFVGKSPLRFAAATSPLRRTNAVLGLEAKLGALIFACDGVVADTDCDGHRTALNMAFKSFGLKQGDKDMVCTPEQYEKLLHIRGKERMERFWNEIGWHDMTTELALQVYDKKSEIFSNLVAEKKIPIRNGIIPLIDEAIQAQIPVAVCSSSTEKSVRQILGMLGPERASKIKVFAGDQVKRRKPAPDVYLLAQIKLGLNPAECVVFEDNEDGLKAAKDAGMMCVITKSKYTQNDKFVEADLVVDDLKSAEVNLEKVAGMAFAMAGLNA